MRLGDADSTRIGNWVLAIGNPLGEAFTFTVTAGIVSAKGRLLAGLNQSRYAIQDFIQTDAAINPGNSGGPLVNVRGEVIGINAAIASETGLYAGYGFAIPINLARTVMTQLIATGHVERAVIGVSIRPITPEDAEDAKLTDIRGVVVNDFTGDDSPAKRAGIQEGDVIVAVDGQSIESVAQLQQRVGFKKPGEMVQVSVVRKGGARKTIPVRLVAAPSAEPEEVADSDDGASRNDSGPMEQTLGISVQPLSQENARDPSLRSVMRAGGGLIVTQGNTWWTTRRGLDIRRATRWTRTEAAAGVGECEAEDRHVDGFVEHAGRLAATHRSGTSREELLALRLAALREHQHRGHRQPCHK